MIKHKGYTGKIEFDQEGGVLHGVVLGVRDVVTFEGRSVDEVMRAFRRAVDGYLAACEKRGRRPEEPRTGKILLRISPDLHRRIATLAKESKVSINSLVSDCLADLSAAADTAAGKAPAGRGRRKARRG